MPRSCGGIWYRLVNPFTDLLTDLVIDPLTDPLADPLTDSLIDPFVHPLTPQMLRELGASPGSVSDARAKAVFDAVLRNGLPETPPNQQWRDSKSHHVMTNGWVAGGSNGNVMVDTFQSTGRKEVSDKAPISGRGRLCWTLFLEAMVGDTHERLSSCSTVVWTTRIAYAWNAWCSRCSHKHHFPIYYDVLRNTSGRGNKQKALLGLVGVLLLLRLILCR